MSHYQAITTQMKDKASLVKALIKMGFKEDQIETHEQATNLYGYQGDKRDNTAEVIIRRKNVGSASNDMGFKKQEDGTYKAIISDYDHGKYGKSWQKKLETQYGVERAKVAFTANGWQYTEKKDAKGRIQLVGTHI